MADRRISELPVIPAVAGDDALAIVDTSLSETNKVSVEDLLRSAPAGTAAAPSIAFVDDPDTGFYRSAANELSISTSGSQRVVVDSAGLVGIGTSSPSATMHLRAANAQLRIQPTADSTQTGRIFFTDQNDNDKFSIQGGGVYGTELVFRSDTTERMRINSSGAIGIGTSSPTQILQLKGSDATLLIQDSATSFSLNQAGILLTCSDVSGDPRTDIQRRIRGDGDDLVFTYGASDTEQLRLTDGGKVGVGTSSPDYKFDILGGAEHTYLRVRAGEINNWIAGVLLGDEGTPSAAQIFYNNGTNNLIVNSNGSERMRIDSTGNVGIGTSSPSRKLSVSDSNESPFLIETTAADCNIRLAGNTSSTGANQPRIGVAGDSFRFQSSGSEHFRITSAGNVGIGTSSPGEKLEVNGTIKATDINFTGLATYADDTAAGTGGLVAGDVYKTSTGELRIKL